MSFVSPFVSYVYPFKGQLIHRHKTPRSLWIAAALLAVVSAGSAAAAFGQVAPEFRTAPRSLITAKLDRSRMVPTPGALNPIVKNFQDLGEAQASLPIEHIQLLLRRTPERQAAFDGQVEALHVKGNPSFHKWLTPQVVGEEFGPSASDLATITGYLASEGFIVDHIGKSGLYIDFSGTATQVEHTFQTIIHTFQVPDSEELKYSAVQGAHIPEALAPAVVGLVSLSNIPAAHTNIVKKAQPVQQPLPEGLVFNASPNDTESTSNYAVAPRDFYTIYNESPLLTASTPINGGGVTIALLEESAITPADVTAFRTTYAVSPAAPVSFITDTGYKSNTCTAPAELKNTEEGEAVLDIEWAGAIAPSANLIFMQCKTASTLGILLSAQAVIDNNLADVMSLSYGQFEKYSPAEDTMAADLWEQAASQGETVVVSAGDTGPAAEDGNYDTSYVKYGITANSFSTTAWNVSAGGTDFLDNYNDDEGVTSTGISHYWNTSNGTGLSSAKSYVPEMTWNNSCGSPLIANLYTLKLKGVVIPSTPENFCGYFGDADGPQNGYAAQLAGGGGAPSALYTRPSWQTGTVFGLPATATFPQRLQPDISLFAANGAWLHDLPVFQSDLPKADQTSYAGGTSFVAPQLAGVFALIVQATGDRQGQPNYVLYNMAGIEYGTSSAVTNSCGSSGASGLTPTPSGYAPAASCIFYDVTSGTSQLPCVVGKANCYTANAAYSYGVLSTTTSTDTVAYPTNTGWDQATGIGSLNVYNLVTNWQSATQSTVFTPVVTVTPATTTYTYGAPPAITFTAIVSGLGSLPTGTVAFAGSPLIGAINATAALSPTTACTTGGTAAPTSGNCYEATTQAYTPSATAISAGTYAITATYAPPATNENYATGTGTASIVVNQQLPTLTVTAPTATVAYGTASVTITARLVYTGAGLVPTTAGQVSFQVGSLATLTATCSASGFTITCNAVLPLGTAVSSGVYTIAATYAGDINYAGVTANGTLTYGKASTITTFSVPGPQHTMYPTVTSPAAVSNSNGPFTYSVVSGPATYQGLVAGKPTFQLTAAGSVTVEAYQAAATSGTAYTPTFVTNTFTVLAGSVWVGDTSNAVSTFDLLGNAIGGSGTGLTGGGISTIASPLAEAFDKNGYLWVASANGVSEFAFPKPAPVQATAITSGGISSPLGLTIDGASQVWVANSNGTISALSNAGSNLSPGTGYTISGVRTTAASIVVDVSGNVWVTNAADSSVTEVIGAAVPANTPSTALTNGTTGATP